jgi:ATP/maltotriose-dependent transcriptional regulator MalT
MGALAYGYYLTRQNQKADRAFGELMATLEKTGRDRTLAAADVLNNWANVHNLGDIRKAQTLYLRSLELHRAIEGSESVNPLSLDNYGSVLVQLARYREAEPLFVDASRIAHDRANLRVELDVTLDLACLYAEQGRLTEAEATLARVEKHEGEKVLQNKLRQATLAYTRAQIARARGDRAGARARFVESVGLFDAVDAKFTFSLFARVALARAELALGNLDAADAAARRAVELAETLVPKDSPSYLIGLAQAALGEVQGARRDPAARATLEAAHTQLGATLGPEHPATRGTGSLLRSLPAAP